MLEKVYIVTDLGPGDGGKGGIIHSLAHEKDASVIIKRGGAQGSHGVRTSRGESFNFSQWGCGTLEGIPTYLSDQMVIMPVGLKNESEALIKVGVDTPFTLLSASPNCICATPFHKLASHLDELELADHPHGTIGSGVGRAFRMFEYLGDEFTIYAHELKDREAIAMKLRMQMLYFREKYKEFPLSNGIASDDALIAEELELLRDDGYLSYTIDLFEEIGAKLRLEPLSDVIKRDGIAIVECSHGVLTDSNTGLRPHVSCIYTLPKYTIEMLRQAGYDGEIINLAVHRAYEIRHGAGPMPTYDEKFTKKMLPGSHKAENRWQGIVRAGPLDLNLLRYALEACKDTPFDGLCLTWFDQVLATDRKWSLCEEYRNSPADDETYVEFLKHAEPIVYDIPIKKPIAKKELFAMVDEILRQKIDIPLSILSVGPTERDKIYSEI